MAQQGDFHIWKPFLACQAQGVDNTFGLPEGGTELFVSENYSKMKLLFIRKISIDDVMLPWNGCVTINNLSSNCEITVVRITHVSRKSNDMSYETPYRHDCVC